MEKSQIFKGKTQDLAVEAALEQLGLDRDSVSVELVEREKPGFLGIGAKPAQIKVTYQVPDEEPKPALSSASRSKPKKTASAPAENDAPKVIAPAAPQQPRPERREQPKPERREQPPRKPRPEREERKPVEPKVYAPAEPGSAEERIEAFVKGLLEHMDSDAVPHAVKKDEGYLVDLVGEDLGILIGRRGETLDAIQHLTNYVINRGNAKRVRISVDAENYREKREESLRRLAQKVAGKVTKYRRNITLEPMNAYERHVIHAALQEYPDVTTFSTGTEPNRRVVVSYTRYKSPAFREEEAE